jgi:hypothetical protein
MQHKRKGVACFVPRLFCGSFKGLVEPRTSATTKYIISAKTSQEKKEKKGKRRRIKTEPVGGDAPTGSKGQSEFFLR